MTEGEGFQCSVRSLLSLNNKFFINLAVTFFCASIHSEGFTAVNSQGLPIQDEFEISAHKQSTCVIDDSGIKCWGRIQKNHPVPSIDGPWVAVSTGNTFGCALRGKGFDREVVCWGDGPEGQIDVPNLDRPRQISAGDNTVCALDQNGLHCWGSDSDGLVSLAPFLVNPTKVKVGSSHACAIDLYGLQCWGDNEFGQSSIPNLRSDLYGIVTDFDVGTGSTCAINSGGAFCWGDNAMGQTNVPGDSQAEETSANCRNSAQVDVENLSNPTDISIGEHACAVDDNGVRCWGKNNFGQTNVPFLSNPTQVVVGAEHTCAVDDGGIECWGRNAEGETNVPELTFTPPWWSPTSQRCLADAAAFGRVDTDQDGVKDACDAFPEDPTETLDSDSDGFGNNTDRFPFDASEWQDTDGDGVGDNADFYPTNPAEWSDTDGDGVGDNADAFPTNADQSVDSDGDGVGDSEDLFPYDPSETRDTDKDGVGDNGDAFPYFGDETRDSDGDGVGDNRDAFPLDPAASTDTDADGRPDVWNFAKQQDDSMGFEVLSNNTGTDLSGVDVDTPQVDFDPPNIDAFSLTPSPVDVTDEDVSVTLRLRITDASGVRQSSIGQASIYHESARSSTVQYKNLVLVSGDEFDGIYEATFTMFRGSLSGTWRVRTPSMQDQNGLQVSSSLRSFVVQSDNSDFDSPEVFDFSVTPLTVDVTNEDAGLRVRLRIVDPSGIDQTSLGTARVYKQSEFSRTVQNQNLVLVSGDEFDGVYEANFTLAEGSRSGIWIAESGGGIRDVNGFQRVSLTTSFNVLSENSDVCPPEIISALTVPSIVDTTNENASFKVRLRIIDAAGVNQTSVGLSTIYNQSAFNETVQNSNFVLIAGDEFDGIYEASFTMFKGSLSGIWTASLSGFQDINGFQTESLEVPFEVVSNVSEINPPEIREFSIIPSIVDVSEKDVSVKVSLRITDVSGVDGVNFGSIAIFPNGAGSIDATTKDLVQLSGDEFDGVYESVFTIAKGSRSGTWIARVTEVQDVNGFDIGELNFTFEVENDLEVVPDSAPKIIESSIVPSTIDVTNNNASVRVSLRIVDDYGVDQVNMSPIRVYQQNAFSSTVLRQNLVLISGDEFDGIYEAVFTIVKGSLSGTWRAELVGLPGIQNTYGLRTYWETTPLVLDDDDDNDGVPDVNDAFPLDSTEFRDTDLDGVGDNSDAFPNDSLETKDTDGDGIGDNSDSFPDDAQVFARQFLQTSSASQNITSLNILNTSSREQAFKGTLWDGNGDQRGHGSETISESVSPMGRLSLSSADLETIFGVEPWQGPAMLRVQGESTFELMSKLISPSGLVSNTNCVREDRVLNIEGFDSNNMSYVRLIHTASNDAVEITGTLYDTNGDVVGDANSVLVSSLAPNQQVWISRDSLADKVGAQWSGEALLEVNDVSGLKLLNLNYITDEETFFNFSCFEDNDSARVYLQTTSTSQNVSLTHLVNTAETEQQFTGTLYSSDGERLGAADTPLHSAAVPAKGRVILSSEDIESAFNISPWSGPAMLEVNGSDTFELMTKLTSPSGLISNTNCVREDQVHNIGGFDQTDLTYVRFINIGDTPITSIRGSLYDATGSVIGETNPVLIDELPAKAQVWRNRDHLSDIAGDTWNGTASLKIENADDNLRLLNLNYINSETFFNFSCYETGQ